MDTSNIPRVFWYALSFCMVSATLGLIFIAYKSSDISIEIADAKIQLSSALAETKEIKSQLKIENERLFEANKDLEEKLALSEELIKTPAEVSPAEDTTSDNRRRRALSVEEIKKYSFKNNNDSELPTPEISKERFQSIDEKIQSVQQSLYK